MDQPFDAGFTINAFNENNQSVKNYALFDPSLQSKFKLESGNNNGGYVPLDLRLIQMRSD